MSKLVDLFNSTQYARLNTIAGGTKNFSVRNQSNTSQEIRQGNAVDFQSEDYQKGFKVDKPTLSVEGFAKAPEAQNSDFTGNPTGTATISKNGFDTYNRFALDSSRKNYNSKLIHKFLATNNNEQYKTKQSASPGIVLTYNV